MTKFWIAAAGAALGARTAAVAEAPFTVGVAASDERRSTHRPAAISRCKRTSIIACEE